MKKKSKKRSKSQPQNPLTLAIGFILWVSGILVSLAVGFGMIQGVLAIPYIHPSITAIAGWIVVALTIIGAILAIIGQLIR